MKPILSIATLLGVLISCNRDTNESPMPVLPLTVLRNDQPACFESRPVIRQSTNLTGRVSFSKEVNSYFISYGVPGTYDSVWIGFVCNLPEAYKVLNKQVIFSGEYRKGPDRAPNFGGEESYYLFLTDIK
jgi:hypothetical protein